MARKEPINFIMVDWSELAVFPWYTEAVHNLEHVWNNLVHFLETYNESGEIPISNVHLIGFSLGAQIAGFTGKKLSDDMRIPRITALDPALPMFPLEGIFVQNIYKITILFGFRYFREIIV